MEIEVNLSATKFWGIVLLATCLILVAVTLLGRSITPIRSGQAVILSWDEWQIVKIKQVYQEELKSLHKMYKETAALLKEKADPVRGQVTTTRILETLNKGGLPALDNQRKSLGAAVLAVRDWSLGTGDENNARALMAEAVSSIKAAEEQQ